MDCKTFIRRFDPARRLQFQSHFIRKNLDIGFHANCPPSFRTISAFYDWIPQGFRLLLPISAFRC